MPAPRKKLPLTTWESFSVTLVNTCVIAFSNLHRLRNRQVYRLFCQRLAILAANMRLKGLSAAIAHGCAMADEILLADAQVTAPTMPSDSEVGGAFDISVCLCNAACF